MNEWVLGVDSGGSGWRVALATARPTGGALPRPAGRVLRGDPVRTGPEGIDARHLLRELVPSVQQLLRDAGGGRVTAGCVGAAGMATLGHGLREELPTALAEVFGLRRLALAADAVTAYAGALGERTGVVVAAGTGMIALGTDLRGWRRADGWGHLLGDCGGGAWIGRAGLEAALRAADGRSGGSASLLARAEAVFGPAHSVPSAVYPRSDRAAVLAAFAPEVARCAAQDDVAAGILDAAAREIAHTAAAAHPGAGDAPAPGPGRATDGSLGHGTGSEGPTGPTVVRENAAAGDVRTSGGAVALTGGLFRIGEPLLAPLRRHLAARLPGTQLTPALGDPLSGALLIGTRLARGSLRLPADGQLLELC